MLVDAPCTGSGVLAKRVDLRWRRTPEDLEELVALQSRLIAVAGNHVKVGGCLCYSTCSIEREENAMQVEAFLEAQGGNFALEETMETFPHRDKCDGAFAARLRRLQ